MSQNIIDRKSQGQHQYKDNYKIYKLVVYNGF